MRERKINDEVLYAEEEPVSVDAARLTRLKGLARENRRGRARLCTHPDPGDTLHEMLIVLRAGNYIRPHRHPGKSESFHVIEGSADLVIFDDTGLPVRRLRLGDFRSGRSFFFRIGSPQFHAVVVSSGVFVCHETTNGPFDREQTEFAPWSPAEDDREGGNQFMQEILSHMEVTDET